MSTPIPQTAAPDAATVWQFRFYICRDRNAGQQMVTLGGPKRRRTQFDGFLNCQAYRCENYAEYELLLRSVVGKTEKSFWGIVELYDPVTDTRRKLDDTMRFTFSQSQAGQAAKSPGSYPGNAGSSPAPATMPAAGGNDETRMTNGEITTGDPYADAVISGIEASVDDGLAAALTQDWEAAKKAAFNDLLQKTLSQTPEGPQSGGAVVEAAPCEPEGTFSDPPAGDADAGTPEDTATCGVVTCSTEAKPAVSARAPAPKKRPAQK